MTRQRLVTRTWATAPKASQQHSASAVAVRHGLIEPDIEYEQLQYLFESNLKPDVPFYNEYHALLVRVGKDFCKPKPKCATCPLAPLPHTIDVER